jgi:hypothetical protein
MIIKWTNKSLSDLSRLYHSLSPVNKQAAAKTFQTLTEAPEK